MILPTPFAPEGFRALLTESLLDSNNSSYGQVATIDSVGAPQVRTVHLRYVPEKNTIGFAANRRSQKWQQLLEGSLLSGCYFDPRRMVQFRWQANVLLLSPEDMNTDAGPILSRMWGEMRTTVRMIYWHEHLSIPFERVLPADVNEVCPSFGVVLCAPLRWDYYELPTENYLEHRRSLHEWRGNHWESSSVAVLTGRRV